MITGEKLIFAVAIMGGITFMTRATPFLLFGSNSKQPPNIITYLGKYLPPAIICTILVYCFCEIEFTKPPFGLKEILAVAVVASFHLWKHNTLISIFTGTLFYMALTQYIF